MNRRPSGFTFLELMTVTAIIGILACMALAAASAARRAARRRTAAASVRLLEHAINEYRIVYGVLPGCTQSMADITRTNCAAVLAALTNNPRDITFIEIPESDMAGDYWVDPWRRPYAVALDDNGDGMIQVNCAYGPGFATNVPGGTAVFSWGPDPDCPDMMVYSWSEK